MPVYGATEAVVSALMKKVYPGAITNQLNEEVGPWALIEKTSKKVFQGQDLNRSLRVGRNQGIGSRGDSDVLPNAGNQRHVQATIKMSTTYIVGEFTGRVVRGTYSDEAAFENAMENEMRNSLTDFTNDIARQVSTGHARLAKYVSGGAISATTCIVDSTLNLGIGQQIVVLQRFDVAGYGNRVQQLHWCWRLPDHRYRHVDQHDHVHSGRCVGGPNVWLLRLSRR
jgi:hypothetical protein